MVVEFHSITIIVSKVKEISLQDHIGIWRNATPVILLGYLEYISKIYLQIRDFLIYRIRNRLKSRQIHTHQDKVGNKFLIKKLNL